MKRMVLSLLVLGASSLMAMQKPATIATAQDAEFAAQRETKEHQAQENAARELAAAAGESFTQPMHSQKSQDEELKDACAISKMLEQ